MAALRNLSRLRESCERLATGDPESTDAPLITMEDCYTIDGNSYEKREKEERKMFGETRIEKINKYALEYRERQRNLLLRREMINKKLFEILRELDPERINNDDVPSERGKESSKKFSNIRDRPIPKGNTKRTSSVNIKNVKKIRELEDEIRLLKQKMYNNSSNFNKELNKYKNLGKKEEFVRKKLGLNNWDTFVRKVKNNNFGYELDQLLGMINDSEMLEVTEDITGFIEDKTLNDDEKTEGRRAKAEKKKEEEKEGEEEEKEDEELYLSRLEEGFQGSSKGDLATKLAVYENIGKIKIEKNPALAAQANKAIDNSIDLVGDFESLASEIIKNIRERYYNNEDTDYKKLVDKTGIIENSKIKQDLLYDANHFSLKNLEIQTRKNKDLKQTTKVLCFFVFITFILALLLVGFLL